VNGSVPISIAAGLTALAALAGSAHAQSGTIFGAGGSVVQVNGPINLTQTGVDNVAGVVQVGPDATTTIGQSGIFNRSAVVQVGNNNNAVITQGGLFNRSLLLQFAPNNAATLVQNGTSNFNILRQNDGVPNFDPGVLVQNFLFAPETIAAQTELGQITARTFTNSLLNHLDASRFESCPQQAANATYSADLPNRPVAAPAPLGCPPFAVYITGTYATGSRDDRGGATGFDYNLGGVTVGAEYRTTPNVLVGTAFNYSHTSGDLNRGLGNTDLDAYQFALYSSISYPNWFLDGLVTYGVDRFDVKRPGFVAPVTASPDGNSFTAAAKGGYLFDVGVVRLGPIAGLAYAKNWVDAYTELGDPLLAQSVSQRDLSALTASAGVQVRAPFGAGGMLIDPYINVTAERDFLNGQRTISTTFLLDTSVPILTPLLSDDDRTYGRIAGGVRVDVTQSISAIVSAEGTFARQDGNDFALNGSLKVRF
jgi:outer membrane lipase/esterase